MNSNLVEVYVDIPTQIANSVQSPVDVQTWHHWFQIWIEDLQATLPPASQYELSLRLTDDLEIKNLNRQYRQKNQSTDVLSFAALETNNPVPWSEYLSTEPLYLGDLVISLDTAQKQADWRQHSLETELAWLASHGLLHLIGWDHPDDASLMAMLIKQETLMHLVGLTGVNLTT